MAPTNLFMKQTHGQKEQIDGCQEGGGGGWSRRLGSVDISYYTGREKQQSPIAEHGEIYSMSCD